ncbi:uncharacterized protein [Palaemon carinicauda]|uniref:uncharacterized protein isoform X2 n=1 Tax=Palaemon carinicauda TaxID=392227 RepID=UPI0035B676DD
MDVFKLFEWNNSVKAIEKLETLLQCDNCKDIAYDAKCLGRCDHFFCIKCVNTIQSGTCPKCKSSGPPSEIQTDSIVASLVASAKNLRHLVDHGERVSFGKGNTTSTLPHTRESCTKPSRSQHRGTSKTKESLNKTSLRDKCSHTKGGISKAKKDLNNSKVKSKAKQLKGMKFRLKNNHGSLIVVLGIYYSLVQF